MNGIITKTGEFIACDDWKHTATSYLNDTSEQFIICRVDIGYNGEYTLIDLVGGELNKQMIDALFDYATSNGVILEDVIMPDMEDALLTYSRMKSTK